MVLITSIADKPTDTEQQIQNEDIKGKIEENDISQTRVLRAESASCGESVQTCVDLSQEAPLAAKRLFDKSDFATDSSPMCRFCLEEDSERNLIQPCLCDGSSKWVHRYVT